LLMVEGEREVDAEGSDEELGRRRGEGSSATHTHSHL